MNCLLGGECSVGQWPGRGEPDCRRHITDGPGELIVAREKTYLAEHYERGFALKTFPGGQREGNLNG